MKLFSSKYYNDFFTIVHFPLAVVLSLSSIIAQFWNFSIFFVAILTIFVTRNKYGHAHLFAVYFAGAEIIAKVTKAGLFHEFTKYAIVILLLGGILAEKTMRRGAIRFVFMFLLLLVSIPFSLLEYANLEDYRQHVMFNLSGPLVLVISSIYFYERRFDLKEFSKLLVYFLAPLVLMSMYISLNVPSISEIGFTSASNRAASLYGPVQVSTILGAGVYVLIILAFLPERSYSLKIIVPIILGLLSYRLLLSFSRSGVISVLLVFFYLILVNFRIFLDFLYKRISLFLLGSFLFLGILFALFSYVNSKTNNLLYYRYAGLNTIGEQNEDISTGRGVLMITDLITFIENPIFGVGAGVSSRRRNFVGLEVSVPLSELRRASSHTEFSRLLAEHGVFGLIYLIMMFYLPFKDFIFRQKIPYWGIKTSFAAFALFTMLYAAMRLAISGLFFGIAFVKIEPNSPS